MKNNFNIQNTLAIFKFDSFIVQYKMVFNKSEQKSSLVKLFEYIQNLNKRNFSKYERLNHKQTGKYLDTFQI